MRLFFRGQRRRLSPGCTDTARRRFASLVTLHRTCCGELSGFIPGSLRQEVSEPWGKLKLTPGGPVWPLPIPPLPSPLLHPLLFLKKKKKSLLLFVCTGSLSRRACSLVFAVVCKTATCYSRTPSCGGGIWLPDQGLNLGPLHWELGILATGPEGKFPSFLLSFFLLSAFKSCSPFLLFLSFPFIKNDREDFPSYASFS